MDKLKSLIKNSTIKERKKSSQTSWWSSKLCSVTRTKFIAITISVFALSASLLLVFTLLPASQASTATLTIFSPFSYSTSYPLLPQHASQFRTVGPINATGFTPGESIKISYFFPSGTCVIIRTADAKGKVYATQDIFCKQGSAVYLGYNASEGTSYNVTAKGQTSGLTASTTFIPTLTNGSSRSLGASCTNHCSTPKVTKSLVHLVYFNPGKNDRYNFIFNNHNAIAHSQKISGFDFASSFSTTVLNLYPVNVTRIILEYNDSGSTNGINQGTMGTNNTWIGYDDERNNINLSTPCIEIENNCPNGTSINATAVYTYTNDASLRVKTAGKHFVWAGEIEAVAKAYKNVTWSRVDAVILQLQGSQYSNNFTKFNSTLAPISDWVRSHNSNTLIFAQVNLGGLSSQCNCTVSTLVHDLQYSRFHAGTPTKWLYDGVSMVINTTPISDVGKFITYLGR